MQRRDFLKASAALAAAGFPATPLLAAAVTATATGKLKHLGAAQAFDYAWLKGQARAQAGHPYQAPVSNMPELMVP